MRIESLTEAKVLSAALTQFVDNTDDDVEGTALEELKMAAKLRDQADGVIAHFAERMKA